MSAPGILLHKNLALYNYADYHATGGDPSVASRLTPEDAKHASFVSIFVASCTTCSPLAKPFSMVAHGVGRSPANFDIRRTKDRVELIGDAHYILKLIDGLYEGWHEEWDPFVSLHLCFVGLDLCVYVGLDLCGRPPHPCRG